MGCILNSFSCNFRNEVHLNGFRGAVDILEIELTEEMVRMIYLTVIMIGVIMLMMDVKAETVAIIEVVLKMIIKTRIQIYSLFCFYVSMQNYIDTIAFKYSVKLYEVLSKYHSRHHADHFKV